MPIGEWLDEAILLVTEDGSVLAETTFEVSRVGKGLARALRLLILADAEPERSSDCVHAGVLRSSKTPTDLVS